MSSQQKELDPRVLAVGKKVKTLRMATNKSYEKWSLDVGIHRMTTYRVEGCCNMTLSTLVILCDKLEISLKDFFSSEEFNQIKK